MLGQIVQQEEKSYFDIFEIERNEKGFTISSSWHAASKDFPDSLSHHSSLLSIASGRSSKLYPVFVQSSCR